MKQIMIDVGCRRYEGRRRPEEKREEWGTAVNRTAANRSED